MCEMLVSEKGKECVGWHGGSRATFADGVEDDGVDEQVAEGVGGVGHQGRRVHAVPDNALVSMNP